MWCQRDLDDEASKQRTGGRTEKSFLMACPIKIFPATRSATCLMTVSNVGAGQAKCRSLSVTLTQEDRRVNEERLNKRKRTHRPPDPPR